jgi:diamine N-acetyltransferase
VVRAANPTDVDVILDVQERASVASLANIFTREHPLPTATIRERWRRAFSRKENRFSVYEADRQIVGVVMVSPPWIHALQVLPQWWGTGVAGSLHDHALATITSAGEQDALLRVYAENHRAVRFWEKHGWERLPWETANQDHPKAEMLWYQRPALADPGRHQPPRLSRRRSAALGTASAH